MVPGLVTSLRYIDVEWRRGQRRAGTVDDVHRWHRAVGLQAEPRCRFHHDERWHPDGFRRLRARHRRLDPAGDLVTVNYSYGEQYLVSSLTRPITDNWLRFEGLNTIESNSPVIVDVFRFSNDPLKELALLSDTFGQFVIEGSVLKDDTRLHGSNYFSIKKLKVAADNAF